jgi:hypothetical protein
VKLTSEPPSGEVSAWSGTTSTHVRSVRARSLSARRTARLGAGATNLGNSPCVSKPFTINTCGGAEVGPSAPHILNLRVCAAFRPRGEVSGNRPSRVAFG